MARKQKDKLDKFYTKSEIVILCLNELNLFNYKSIIEPAAGNGSFSKQIKNCISFDIDPKHKSIIKEDFLKLNLLNYNFLRPILVIGNPPFGVQNSLALKFIKKSAKFADMIAFILPKSFKKQSLQDKVPLNFHLIKEFDIPDMSFLLNNVSYDVPTVFQIWEKKTEIRKKEKRLYPKTFLFVKKNEKPDLSFRRVGVYAGNISKDILSKSAQSHYFIKVNNVNEFLNKVNKIKWKHNNTTGPKSISKQELIREVEK